MKRYLPAIGIPHIIFITKSGTIRSYIKLNKKGVAFPPYHFTDGGARDFFHALQTCATLTKSDEDANLFFLNDPMSSIKHSQPVKNKEVKAIENVSWTILEGFSKVTHLARQAASGKLLKEPSAPRNRQAFSDVGTWELLLEVRKFREFSENCKDESLPKVERLLPVTKQEWLSFFDNSGKIPNEVSSFSFFSHLL
jgi:hypothetical protein